MINSMTAFARQEVLGDYGTLVWEIRSVNHRYLDLNFRLPEGLHCFEESFNTQVKKYITRGKCDCYLSFQPSVETFSELTVNLPMVRQLVKISDKIGGLVSSAAPISITDILSWEGIVQHNKGDLTKLEGPVNLLLEETLKILIQGRKREGEAINIFLTQRLQSAFAEVEKLTSRLANIVENIRERLHTKIAEAEVKVDPTRLEQEVVLLANKSDVAEELSRLKMHIKEVENNLTKSGAVGRRLDFLMQELNREANTLGSKATDIETTSSVVELKVLIEQMREQIQNIE